MSLQSKKTFCLFDEEEIGLEDVSKSDDWIEEDEEGEIVKKKKAADPIRIYFKEVFSHKLLTKEDEVRIGQNIEKNEKIILQEVLNFYSPAAKFYHLLIQSERKGKLSLLFKDWEDLDKKGHKVKEWLENLKQVLAQILDNPEDNSHLKKQIIDLIYEVRPTKLLLDELSCEILETYKIVQNLNNLKTRFQNKYNLSEKDWEALFSVNGNRAKMEEYACKFSITSGDLQKIKKDFLEYKKFMKRFNEFFGESLEEVYNSGKIINKAFQEIKKYKEELVKSNLRLIISLARKYSPKGMYLADLIQEGNIGLLKAIEKFDYRKGFKFSTYATWWIRQSITRYLAENTRTIRIPLHIIETIYKISKIISTKFYQEYGKDPTLDELAKATGLSIEKLNYVFKVMKQPISLETTVGDEDDSTLRDFIEDQNAIRPEEATFNVALSEKIRELLKTLSPREEKIIRLRFGIGEKESCTLEEVGNKFGVTKERIRQIESIALRKLKHPNRIKLLKNFLIYGS